MRARVLKFAPSASGQNGSGGSPAGSFSTNAFVSDALRNERTSHCDARNLNSLSLLTPACERNAARRTIWVVGIGPGRKDANEATGILLLPIVIAAICTKRSHTTAP